MSVSSSHPGPHVVVAGESIVAIDDSTAQAFGWAQEELVGKPFTALIAPEGREVMRDRHLRRLRGEPVAPEYEVSVLTGSGERRRVRVHVDYDGERMVVAFADVTSSSAPHEWLAAFAHIGHTLQGQPNKATIFRTVCDQLLELGLSSGFLRPEGDHLILDYVCTPRDSTGPLQEAAGGDHVGLEMQWAPMLRQAWRDGVVFTADAILTIGELVTSDRKAALAAACQKMGFTRMAVLRLDVGRPWALLAVVGPWLEASDLTSLRLFCSQVCAGFAAAESLVELTRRNAELAALNRLAALARTANDMATLFSDGAVEMSQLARAAVVAFYLIDRGDQEMRLAHFLDVRGRLREIPDRVVFAGMPRLEERIARGDAAVYHTPAADDPLRRFFRQLEIEVVAAVPLMARNQVLGLMVVGIEHERDVDSDELELLTATGAHFATAIESQQLLEDQRRRIAELTLLHDVARSLTGTLDSHQILEQGSHNLAKALGVSRALIWLADDKQEWLSLCAGGSEKKLLGCQVRIDPSVRSILVAALLQRRSFTVEDAVAERSDPLLLLPEARAYLVLPLVVRDRAIGATVVADTTRPRRFNATEIERVTTIASQLAIAIDNARLFDDLKRSYDELARAQAQIVDNERLAALGELAAVVAHEVRNPLSVIFNSIVTLQRLAGQSPDARRLLDILGEEAERLNHIVSDLLDFARPVNPTLSPEVLPRVLDDAVASALADVQVPITIVRAFDPELPPVPMDIRLLRQALLNVVMNAVQAMPQGGTLSLTARRRSDPKGGRVAEISFTDSGQGISPEAQRRIFEPFFTTKASGTGLGLAVVKRIITGHRGAIQVTSKPGVGTTVAISLPLADEGGLEVRAVT